MSFLAFLVLGLLAGAIAKLILPGKQGGGWFVTLLLGVVGALLGGWLGSLILNRPLTEFWDLGTWLLAIGGDDHRDRAPRRDDDRDGGGTEGADEEHADLCVGGHREFEGGLHEAQEGHERLEHVVSLRSADSCPR